MAGYYAYSNFKVGEGDDAKTIKFGESISQSDLGVDDEEWEQLIEDQAVGEEPVPEDLGNETLAQYKLRQAKEDYEAAQAGEIIAARKGAESKTTGKKDESATSKPQ